MLTLLARTLEVLALIWLTGLVITLFIVTYQESKGIDE